MKLYENADIMVKSNNVGAIVAGYKGDKKYIVHGVKAEDFADGNAWRLSYISGATIYTNIKKEYGASSGLWIKEGRFNEFWYKNMNDGRFMREDGETRYSVHLCEVDAEGEIIRTYFMGFTDVCGIEKPW